MISTVALAIGRHVGPKGVAGDRTEIELLPGPQQSLLDGPLAIADRTVAVQVAPIELVGHLSVVLLAIRQPIAGKCEGISNAQCTDARSDSRATHPQRLVQSRTILPSASVLKGLADPSR